MDPLTAFGAVAVTFVMLMEVLESHHRGFILSSRPLQALGGSDYEPASLPHVGPSHS